MTLAYPFVPCPPEYEVRLKSGPTISIDESTAKIALISASKLFSRFLQSAIFSHVIVSTPDTKQ